MERVEFDRFADEYEQQHAENIRVSGESPEYFARYKVQDVARVLGAQGPGRILDFGAGVGASVPHWRDAFPKASLTCLDVSERSLAIARERYREAAEFRSFDGRTVPFAARTFDVAFAACVFHHIEPTRQVPLLRELYRVLADDGALFIFEHNPYNPLTRRAVDTCPFDENAILIAARTLKERLVAAGFRRISVAYRIFFPRQLRVLRPLEGLLTGVPLGAQYRICARKR
ncbi:class I SAM-dependent methyltransferase [Aromatoleum toluclasticum]|uniref:class I SAM-dependent methyltransferase n=1 Tax=Aromatoleum toluclasticum TaxID=92003 RepID=UPI0004758965|nr:class I SAM-dependent methyltransferase [Aromatoleum toluclasticum]